MVILTTILHACARARKGGELVTPMYREGTEARGKIIAIMMLRARGHTPDRFISRSAPPLDILVSMDYPLPPLRFRQ